MRCWEKKPKKGAEQNRYEVVQAANVAKHHKDVINFALLLRYFLREGEVKSRLQINASHLGHYLVRVQVIYFLWLVKLHEIDPAVLKLCPVLAEGECVPYWIIQVQMDHEQEICRLFKSVFD